MQSFNYQVPHNISMSTKIPIINEKGEYKYTLQKQPHKLLTKIVHELIRGGLPFCYKISDVKMQPFYSIDCQFTGIGYKLTEHLSQQTVSIMAHRVHLIEKAYSFTLNNHSYYFEKNATITGHLKCDDQQIATVSIPFDTNISREFDMIIVNASTKEIAALAAVLYQTFYYWNA